MSKPMDTQKVKHDALCTMWNFLQMGNQKANIPALKEQCCLLQRAMTQKTAGQRTVKPKDVDFDDLDAITNGIVIEAMALYLSGTLDRLEVFPDG